MALPNPTCGNRANLYVELQEPLPSASDFSTEEARARAKILKRSRDGDLLCTDTDVDVVNRYHGSYLKCDRLIALETRSGEYHVLPVEPPAEDCGGKGFVTWTVVLDETNTPVWESVANNCCNADAPTCPCDTTTTAAPTNAAEPTTTTAAPCDFEPVEPDEAPSQENLGKIVRVCCAPPTPPTCTEQCQWTFESGGNWSLTDAPCGQDCGCSTPPQGLEDVASTGSTTYTSCVPSHPNEPPPPDPEGGGPCPPISSNTTTTASPGPSCDDFCHWSSDGQAWALVNQASLCPGVLCEAPTIPPSPCSELIIPPVEPPSTPEPFIPCGGQCEYHWDRVNHVWEFSGLGCRWWADESCVCNPPTFTPAQDCAVTSTLCGVRSSEPPPNPGGCNWTNDGAGNWTLASSECSGNSNCSPPASRCGDVARTCCVEQPTTTSTTTTTTSTTTTKNCCEIFSEDPYIAVCEDSNKVVLRPQEDGTWTGVTILPCGDQFGARVECTPATKDDCSGFTLKFNMPCADPPIFDGKIVECQCQAYQDPNQSDPQYLFIWEADPPIDTSGCGCCGGHY